MIEENYVLKLLKAFNHWLKVPQNKLQEIFTIMELLCAAELLFDDIRDNVTDRNGLPTAQTIYGLPITINVVGYLRYVVLEKILEYDNTEIVKRYLEHSLEFYRALGMEIYWRDNIICPTEEEYKKNIIRKSSTLILFALRLMQQFSENKQDFTKLTRLLGIYFQIYNDYETEIADRSEDSSERKFTFPIIHAIQTQPDIMRQKTKQIEVKKYLVSLLEKYGSLDYTKKTLNKLKEEIQEELQKIEEPNPIMLQIVCDIILLQPAQHILQIPGKKVRSKLSRAFNNWLKIPKDKVERIENILEIIHTHTLLLDDIQDSSTLRRGIPTAHLIYGIPAAIVTGNYIGFCVALEKVLELQHPQAVEIFTELSLELYRGQGMDIYWRDNVVCPTEDEYKEMCSRSEYCKTFKSISKECIFDAETGVLFLLSLRLMQLFSSDKTDFEKFVEKVGLFFQIRDDYMNLCSDEYSANKNYCEDLTEGKFSFPIIHAIHAHPDDQRILNIIKQKPKDYETKKSCVELLKQFGSLDYTKQELIKLKKEALQN
ncbi:polyprenyl synt domain containing protein, partial [Asbolus verrucosus]